MKMTKTIISLFLISNGIVPVFAQSQIWKIDPLHSSIQFAANHWVVDEVVGQFNEYDATLITSKDDFSDATLEATINIQSIDTDNERRDTHLRSVDFFYVEKYPEMRFNSKTVEQIDVKTYNITGDLTIRGITKTVVFKSIYGGMITDPLGKTRSDWQASTTINRFDFGLKWDETIETGGLIVGKEIRIKLDAQFILQE